MRTLGTTPCFVVLFLLMTIAAVTAPQTRSSIVVELFTSEGCSSCPPADALLQKLAESDSDVIALGEHVDYWDRLGWKDRFSSAALTARQQTYADRFNVVSIYTPQMVVDGREEFVGSDAAAARRALDRARSAGHGTVRLAVDTRGPAIAVIASIADLPKIGRGDRADIVVAVTEDRLRSSVTGGENRGRMLPHAAVVRYMATVGEAAAAGESTAHAEIAVGRDWQRDALNVVAFVQERRGRAILAASATRPFVGSARVDRPR